MSKMKFWFHPTSYVPVFQISPFLGKIPNLTDFFFGTWDRSGW